MTTDDSTVQPADSSSSSSGKEVQGELSGLRERIAELEDQVAKLTDFSARAQADLQNYKDRARREAEDSQRHAAASILTRCLPVFDDIDRYANAHLHNGELQEGIAQLKRSIDSFCRECGLERFGAPGDLLDPQLHEVLMIDAGEKDRILAVFECGYTLHGKVIRPAKVKAGVDAQSAVVREDAPTA